jgi:CheY-like chemotaxis protein
VARILIIDDEEPVRNLIRQILERAGYEVVEALDGKVGMERFQEQSADLVIVDILMPEQEGIETIRILHKEFPQTKILAISGGGRMRNLDILPVAQIFGAHRTLAKPFERKDLLEAVDALLA